MHPPDKGVLPIGEDLIAIKNRLPHKLFIPWIESELRLSTSMVQRYMKVTKLFGDNCVHIAQLSLSTLYELSLPSIPKELVDSVLTGAYTPSERELREINRGQPERKEPTMIHSEKAKPREATVQDIAEQLAKMQQQIAAMPPQVEEVVKYVTPSEILEENERLRQEATKWHSEWEKIVEDRKIVVEQYNTLEEKYEKVVQERDVLMENWNAVSKNNKSMVGKISSLSSLVERFHEEYLQIKKANALVIDSTVVTKQNGES